MNRLLVMLALSTLAGCSCWDSKYQQYCDATGKCTVGGPITSLRFAQPQRDINARECFPVQVALGLPDGGLLQPFPSTTFNAVADPPEAVHTWDNDKCSGVPVSQFTAVSPTREFWFQTEVFGEVELRAQILGAGPNGGDVYRINSRAFFSWDPAGYYAPADACTGMYTAKLQARSGTGDMPVPAARETLLQIIAGVGFAGLDVDGGCVEAPVVRVKAGDSSTTMVIGSTFGTTGLLVADAGFFENSFAIARLSSTCAPLSTPCGPVNPGCCMGGSCDGGGSQMFCEGPNSTTCYNNTDCETGSCGSNGKCQ